LSISTSTEKKLSCSRSKTYRYHESSRLTHWDISALTRNTENIRDGFTPQRHQENHQKEQEITKKALFTPPSKNTFQKHLPKSYIAKINHK